VAHWHVCAVLVGAWALLTATRITRGEEDAGRWDLLLAGRLRLTDAVGWHLAVLVAAQLLIGAALAVAMVLAGTAVVGSLLYGAAVGLVGVVFAALGTLTAQLVPSRQTTAGLAGATLGAGLLLRMIADGATSAAWLRGARGRAQRPPARIAVPGAALFALGWVPHAVLPVGVLPAAGGYLVQVLADTFSWPAWVAQLSPFAHVATVPAAPADWPGAIGILAVAALLALTGAVGYARRNLRG